MLAQSARALSLVVCLSGCYSYVRADGPPPVGSEVRAELTDAGITAAAPLLGPNISSLTGNVSSVEPDRLGLSMRSVTKRNGVEEYWAGEAFSLDRSQITALSVRRMSVWRTALLAVVSGGVSFVVAKGISENLDGGGGGTPRPPSQ